MVEFYKNWSIQIKKGYLELCVLSLLEKHNRLYGFQLIKLLEEIDLVVKEGTLYPLMNRMTEEKILKAIWETKEVKGHPRKFYSITKTGLQVLEQMKTEYINMGQTLERIKNLQEKNNE